jgi:hypothetical protein
MIERVSYRQTIRLWLDGTILIIIGELNQWDEIIFYI